MARFDGKKVLITGGTSGIGLAAAKRIAAEGGVVAVTGRSEKHLEDAAKALPKGALVLKNDAADPASAPALAAAVKDEMGALDGLFLNAGYGKFLPTEANDAAFFDHMNNVNVRGPVLQMAALKGLLKDRASVLLTASVATHTGPAMGAVYAATKAADAALARAWAADLAPRGVRVNSLAPGPIETNFVEGMNLTPEQEKAFAESILARVPLGRFGTADEAAAVACFLLSDDASYVTGSEYVVDGGMTFR